MPYDADGRPIVWDWETGQRVIEPHRMTPVPWLRMVAIAGLKLDDYFTGEVPGEFWSQDIAEDDWPVAKVACPCGSTPEVRLGLFAHCACHRGFWWNGTTVRVGYATEGLSS
jgi:hypothetical protein